jgi:hypothetical protein
MEKNTNIALIENTVSEFKTLVEDATEYQLKVSPIYRKLNEKILEMLSKEDELAHMEMKDLLKVLEISNKAQLQPVEQLTKLVQSVTQLYEKTQLQNKVNELTAMVEQFKQGKQDVIDHEDNDAQGPINIDEVDAD